jgi:hypothetical protein
MLLSGRAHLINDATTRSQLSSLERVVLSGRETVRHPHIESAHDDVAAAVCGALVTATQASLGLAALSLDEWSRIFADVNRMPPRRECGFMHGRY